MTFSAPKSVSLLAYIGGDKRLIEAHTNAVKMTLAWAEKNLAETRVSRDSRAEVVKTGNLVVALLSKTPTAISTRSSTRMRSSPTRRAAPTANGARCTTASSGTPIRCSARSTTPRSAAGSMPLNTTRSHRQVRHLRDRRRSARCGRHLHHAASRDPGVARTTLDRLSPAGLRGVTLCSRAEKDVVGDRDELRQTWRERAAAIGLNLQPLVDAAHARVTPAAHPSLWNRLVKGVRDGVERAGTVTEFVPGHGSAGIDPYLPNHASPTAAGRLAACMSARARADIAERRREWISERQPAMRRESHRLVFIDETSVNTKMTRRRGRAGPGKRFKASVPFGKWVRRPSSPACAMTLDGALGNPRRNRSRGLQYLHRDPTRAHTRTGRCRHPR